MGYYRLIRFDDQNIYWSPYGFGAWLEAEGIYRRSHSVYGVVDLILERKVLPQHLVVRKLVRATLAIFDKDRLY